MATPRVLGHLLRLTANLCLAREASVSPVSHLVPTPTTNSFQTRTQEGLVGPATTGDNADHAASVAAHDLLGARGELDAGLALIGVVADNGDVVAGGTAKGAAVTGLLLDVGDDGTLGKRAEGQDVADGQGGVLAGVDELAGVHALVGNEGLGLLPELIGRVEDDTGERRTTTGVVDDLLHDATNVAMALRVIEGAELRRGLPETSIRGKDGPAALTLVADLEGGSMISMPPLPSRDTLLAEMRPFVVVASNRKLSRGQIVMIGVE